ncbi:MAG: hypothetical protein H0W02_14000 [Ktedonobacteraceae bacterium]|nr:hypothetical protein [Ktedonobacteraceae bacterium]
MSHPPTIELRPVDPQSDFPRMAELYNTFEPEPLTWTIARSRASICCCARFRMRSECRRSPLGRDRGWHRLYRLATPIRDGSITNNRSSRYNLES